MADYDFTVDSVRQDELAEIFREKAGYFQIKVDELFYKIDLMGENGDWVGPDYDLFKESCHAYEGALKDIYNYIFTFFDFFKFLSSGSDSKLAAGTGIEHTDLTTVDLAKIIARVVSCFPGADDAVTYTFSVPASAEVVVDTEHFVEGVTKRKWEKDGKTYFAFYNPDGKLIVNVVYDKDGSQTFYDPNGKLITRSDYDELMKDYIKTKPASTASTSYPFKVYTDLSQIIGSASQRSDKHGKYFQYYDAETNTSYDMYYDDSGKIIGQSIIYYDTTKKTNAMCFLDSDGNRILSCDTSIAAQTAFFSYLTYKNSVSVSAVDPSDKYAAYIYDETKIPPSANKHDAKEFGAGCFYREFSEVLPDEHANTYKMYYDKNDNYIGEEVLLWDPDKKQLMYKFFDANGNSIGAKDGSGIAGQTAFHYYLEYTQLVNIDN